MSYKTGSLTNKLPVQVSRLSNSLQPSHKDIAPYDQLKKTAGILFLKN
jgi:hypothetical protein